MKTFSKFAVVALTLSLFGAGCTFGQKQPAGPPTGGMWFSPDRGTSWQQITVKVSSAGISNWADVDVLSGIFDPQDSGAIYVGTKLSGMFYTYDAGATWMQPKDLATGSVQSVAVHPKNKCVIFAAAANRILKSDDCSRTFVPSFFFENGETIKAVIIDWYTPSTMYAVAQGGSLFKSVDNGVSWSVAYRFDSRVAALVMDPKDSRTLLAGTDGSGIWKSTDGGTNWSSLAEATSAFPGSTSVNAIATSSSLAGQFLVATSQGLLETKDQGVTWRSIPLLTPAASSAVLAVAVDPKVSNNLYYATAAAFYRTMNAGANWETIKLPTRRAAGIIMVHPVETDSVYLGAKNLGQ